MFPPLSWTGVSWAVDLVGRRGADDDADDADADDNADDDGGGADDDADAPPHSDAYT